MVLDDFSTGRPQNLEHHRGNSHLRLHQVDVSQYEKIAPLFQGIDWVFHLAALADIVPSMQMPLKYHRANVDGTAAVVEAARQAGVKRLVYTASSSCYGLPDVVPTPETAAIRPMYPYALTKYLGEQIVMHWQKTYRLPACRCGCSTFTVRAPGRVAPTARCSACFSPRSWPASR